MLASTILTTALLAAFSGLAAASPVPQTDSIPELPESADEVCFPSAEDVETYIQARDTGNRLWVSENAKETSPLSSLLGSQTRWRIDRTGSEPNEYLIRLRPTEDLLIQPGKVPDVELGLVDDARPRINPVFRMGCQQCRSSKENLSPGSVIGTNCFIIDVPLSGNNVTYLTEAPKPELTEGFITLSPLTLKTNQLFHIIVV